MFNNIGKSIGNMGYSTSDIYKRMFSPKNDMYSGSSMQYE